MWFFGFVCNIISRFVIEISWSWRSSPFVSVIDKCDLWVKRWLVSILHALLPAYVFSALLAKWSMSHGYQVVEYIYFVAHQVHQYQYISICMLYAASRDVPRVQIWGHRIHRMTAPICNICLAANPSMHSPWMFHTLVSMHLHRTCRRVSALR